MELYYIILWPGDTPKMNANKTHHVHTHITLIQDLIGSKKPTRTFSWTKQTLSFLRI